MEETKREVDSQGQVLLPSIDLFEDMAFFSNIGFVLDQIYPSDDPEVANMSGHGLRIRLDKNAKIPPVTLHILTDRPQLIHDSKSEFLAPNGTQFILSPRSYQLDIPTTQHTFEVRRLRDNDPWVVGRAGMLYRDLIPNRMGGSIIASHIRIPDGGPVPDMVHYHTIGFQLIFCYRGWVRLVYEDQGPPFILNAGDCVTQPPEIRHRVLEASDNLEVIEIGVPAEHMTTIDHEMELPTGKLLPDREFQGQSFCHHVKKDASWIPWRLPGFEYRDTGIDNATRGLASVQVIQALNGSDSLWTSHDCDILFTFIMEGTMELHAREQKPQVLQAGDAFVTPPGLRFSMQDCSPDLELLEVSLPGNFKTIIY